MDKRAKERVAIAKDALAWIEAGALIPRQGVYVQPIDANISQKLLADLDLDNKQLRDVVLGKCETCAMGALFIAKAVRYNNVLASQWNDASIESDYGGAMTEHFDVEELRLIEALFEMWPSRVSGHFI